MTLCVRVSLIKPGGLSLISASYMVEREPTPASYPCSYVCCGTYPCVPLSKQAHRIVREISVSGSPF